MSPRILIVGARSTRQGTGPFIAAGLAAAGANIAGIVGTSEASVAEALADLARERDIQCEGHTDLDQAIAASRPDAVAICSPWRFHAEQLATVAASGCHCLVEKPLVWPASEEQVSALIGEFERRTLLLEMVAQWPATLPAFGELHGGMPEIIEAFSMRLSPISIGQDMITDAAPHFISMLQALLGAGEFSDWGIEGDGSGQLILSATYCHATGETRSRLLLQTCEQRPRPAWYSINDLRADRRVQLPDYQQFLTGGQREVAIADPMHLVTARFLDRLQALATTDCDKLLAGHRNLLQLAAAWQ